MSIKILHSIGHSAYKKKIPFIPFLCKLLIRLLFNSAIDPKTHIGSGTVFGYGGIATIIHKKAIIGRNCIIGSCVTIGTKQSMETGDVEVPKIGNNVVVSSGAKILGGITVGDNSIIGANAVVIHSVPPNVVVAGVPAKIVKQVEAYVIDSKKTRCTEEEKNFF